MATRAYSEPTTAPLSTMPYGHPLLHPPEAEQPQVDAAEEQLQHDLDEHHVGDDESAAAFRSADGSRARRAA
jgi:hypothetical protein